MKKIICLMLSALVLAATFGACKSAETPASAVNSGSEKKLLTVAMELAYPPFETKDSAGEAEGISVDFSRAFAEYIGMDIKIENISWDGLIPSLQTGKADMVISSMTINPERAETVDFSDPYANAMLAVLANKGSGITAVEDLNKAGKKIAVKTGSTGYFYAQKNLKEAEIIALADESACVTEVSQGKADGFIYDQLTIYRNQQKNADSTEAIFIPFQDVDKWGVAVKKGNTALQTKLNEFIAKYTEDGGFDKLTEKYLKDEKKAFDELGFKWFFDMT